MQSQKLAPHDWLPVFVDYLYLIFTHATAFGGQHHAIDSLCQASVRRAIPTTANLLALSSRIGTVRWVV